MHGRLSRYRTGPTIRETPGARQFWTGHGLRRAAVGEDQGPLIQGRCATAPADRRLAGCTCPWQVASTLHPDLRTSDEAGQRSPDGPGSVQIILRILLPGTAEGSPRDLPQW